MTNGTATVACRNLGGNDIIGVYAVDKTELLPPSQIADTYR